MVAAESVLTDQVSTVTEYKETGGVGGRAPSSDPSGGTEVAGKGEIKGPGSGSEAAGVTSGTGPYIAGVDGDDVYISGVTAPINVG